MRAAHTDASTAQALRGLAAEYARAMDRNDPAGLRRILTADVSIQGPGFAIAGIEQACAVPASLREQFASTRHTVHNQTFSVAGSTAEGEVYCTALHLRRTHDGQRDVQRVLVWELRYQDAYLLQGERWLIQRRRLCIDWTEERQGDPCN